MTILVTGGAGSIGRIVVARLQRNGHQVRVLDRVPESDIEEDAREAIAGADYHQIDITDFNAVQPLLQGIDRVVHLAAIPHPAGAPEAELFRINVTGAFNIYRAAADAGIKRVVSASSINALGYNYGIVPFPIEYLPMDEEHPTYTTDPYSYSKQILEETAAYFWRREGISGVCLRFPFVMRPSSRWGGRFSEIAERRKQAYEQIAAMPEEERRTRISAALAKHNERRAARDQEKPFDRRMGRGTGRGFFDMPEPEMMLMFGRADFWTIMHVEDAAQACEKGLFADYEGSHPLYVADSRNSLGVPSRKLADCYYPEVTTWKRPVEGAESLVSIDRARALIGFEPELHAGTW